MSKPIATPVTGTCPEFDPASPLGALEEFYRAFNARDLALMERNWLNSAEASMDNPLGGIKRGWDEIATVYRRIFSGSGRVQVEFFDYTLHVQSESFLAVGRERGTLDAAGQHLDLKIRTSRWFVRADGRWRQLHHHGSIEDADLLSRYQVAVR
jgi:hypothetical protein